MDYDEVEDSTYINYEDTLKEDDRYSDGYDLEVFEDDD
jgi:hypothetical protein